MAKERAETFMKALQEFERTGDVEPFLQLFSDDCEVSNVSSPHRFKGREGARAFWREYKAVLGNVRSTFRNAIEGSERLALEWQTQGAAATGAPIAYEGVSILEYDDDGRVRRFSAYFDPHRLGLELQERERDQRAPA